MDTQNGGVVWRSLLTFVVIVEGKGLKDLIYVPRVRQKFAGEEYNG